MIKKLTKHGNSWALIIDKPVLDLLKIDPETPLEVSTDGQVLTISPTVESGSHSKVKASLEKVNRRHGGVLKKLAE